MMSDESNKPSSCPAPAQPHQSNLAVVELQPDEPVADYRVAWKRLLYYFGAAQQAENDKAIA